MILNFRYLATLLSVALFTACGSDNGSVIAEKADANIESVRLVGIWRRECASESFSGVVYEYSLFTRPRSDGIVRIGIATKTGDAPIKAYQWHTYYKVRNTYEDGRIVVLEEQGWDKLGTPIPLVEFRILNELQAVRSSNFETSNPVKTFLTKVRNEEEAKQVREALAKLPD